MGHNSWQKHVKMVETLQRSATDHELAADALDLVEKWNADLKLKREDRYGFRDRQHYPQFSPHIGAAIRSGHTILKLVCSACECDGQVDLTKVVRPPDFPIAAIYDALVCGSGRCGGNNPRPIVLGLFPANDRALEEAQRSRKIARGK